MHKRIWQQRHVNMKVYTIHQHLNGWEQTSHRPNVRKGWRKWKSVGYRFIRSSTTLTLTVYLWEVGLFPKCWIKLIFSLLNHLPMSSDPAKHHLQLCLLMVWFHCFVFVPVFPSVPWFSVQAGPSGLSAENCPVLSPAQHLQQGESWGAEPGWRAYCVWGKSNHMEHTAASLNIFNVLGKILDLKQHPWSIYDNFLYSKPWATPWFEVLIKVQILDKGLGVEWGWCNYFRLITF